MKNALVSTYDRIPEDRLASLWATPSAVETTDLFGLALLSTNLAQAADIIVSRALLRTSTMITFANAHCINVARSDPAYHRIMQLSDLCLPDGIGMAIAARWHGRALGENLNGTDLFPLLCERAARRGLGIFMLGGLPGVAEAASEWASDNYPGLRIAGSCDGFFADDDALVAAINASKADMLFVGMGVPLQEKWLSANRRRLRVPVILGVGGLFDYYSGRIPRAPKPVRAIRCEWLWRLAMEPRRMAKRYLLGNATFLAHAALAALADRQVVAKVDAAVKRMIDIVVASVALLCLLPLFVMTALAIALEDRGPVLFRQTRIGADGRPFTMLKFRSMFVDAEARRADLLAQSDRAGASFKMRRDPRITQVGRIIRRLSIDELPQLLNVLGGSMSLVGPRPALPSEVVTYRGRHWDRLRGKPGITCTWQVRGRAEIPFHRQAIMDRAYLRRRTIGMDMILLARTLPAVAGGRGAY